MIFVTAILESITNTGHPDFLPDICYWGKVIRFGSNIQMTQSLSNFSAVLSCYLPTYMQMNNCAVYLKYHFMYFLVEWHYMGLASNHKELV